MHAGHYPALFLTAALCALATPLRAAPLARIENAPRTTRIRAVQVLDPATGTLAEPADVWLQGGRIAAFAAPEAEPPGGLVAELEIDGSGQVLVPGLIDCHVHLLGLSDLPGGPLKLPPVRRTLSAFLASGVTTVFDAAATQEPLDRARAALEERRWAGPEIRYAGPAVTAPGGHPVALLHEGLPRPLHHLVEGMYYEIEDPAEAPDAVRYVVGLGAHALKIVIDEIPTGVPELDHQRSAALVSEAHRLGLPVFAHVGDAEGASVALDTGVDALLHLPYRAALPAALVGELGASGITIVPTIQVWSRVAELERRSVQLHPLEEALEPAASRRLQRRLARYQAPDWVGPWLTEVAAGEPTLCGNIQALRDVGVRLAAGSDSPNVGSWAGSGLHRELELLVGCGLTPLEALRSATSDAADLLGVGQRTGRPLEGYEADLLLLPGDPRADLSLLHRPTAIWSDGRRVTTARR